MITIPDVKGHALNDLLDELDAKAEQRYTGERGRSYWVCQRKHARHPFRAACTVRFLLGGFMTVTSLPGRTRNLSRNGIGVLVRRLFRQNEPMELEVELPDRPRMYMAGLATFCRYAGRGFHEVGVQLHTVSPEAVFSADPITACERYDWLRTGQRAMSES